MIHHVIYTAKRWPPSLEGKNSELKARHIAWKRPPFHLLPALTAADPSKRLSVPGLLKHRAVTVRSHWKYKQENLNRKPINKQLKFGICNTQRLCFRLLLMSR